MMGKHAEANRISWVIVAATGVMLGIFVWKTYLAYTPHLHPIEIKEARWMASPNESPQGYFRKELFVPESVQQAWIKVAASDSFILYVNGELAGRQSDPLRNTSRVDDIGSYLRSGKNVIGIQVARISCPGPAKAVVEGAYMDSAGREHAFFSDASWRASASEESQDRGARPWYAVKFDASGWPSPEVRALTSDDEVYGIGIHPDAITTLPKGKWVGHADPGARSVVFENVFELNRKARGTWVRVAAYDRYDLSVNGIVIASRDISGRSLDIYDIGPLVREGKNSIRASVTAFTHAAPRLILDVLCSISHQPLTLLATDNAWRSRAAEEDQWGPPTELADYSPSMDGLTRTAQYPVLPPSHDAKQTLNMSTCILTIVFALILAWKGTSFLIYRLNGNIGLWGGSILDAVLHLPCLLFLTSLFALQYDIRYDPAFPFQEEFIFLALAYLFISKAALLLEAWIRRKQPGIECDGNTRTLGVHGALRVRPALLAAICITLILAAGLFLRVESMKATSLSHDEVGTALFARTILERGHPVKAIGPLEKPLTTYELLPYPIALSMSLFGSSDVAVRLPAVIFGALTILLIYYAGMKLWGPSTGILASAIYAFSPFSIVWGSNAFHPQQTQFFALLTGYLFYQAVVTGSKEIKPGYLYGATLAFMITYLSWEGSGILLIALFCFLLTVRGRDLSWLRCGHLWIAASLIGMVVLLQLSVRILANVPYIVVGRGLSGATFELFFLNPLYDPWFYVRNFLLGGNTTVLALLALLGIPLLVRDIGFRYCLLLLAVPLMMLTNFLPNVSVRYAYFVQTFLILAASAVTVYILTSIRRQLAGGPLWKTARASHSLFAVCLPLIVFLVSNNQVLHLYRLGTSLSWASQMLPEIYGNVDYRTSEQFVKDRLRPEDIVISLMPHTFEYYAQRRSNYYVQAYTSRQIFYDVSEETLRYMDKYTGSPVIRSIDELEDVLNRHPRAWIIAAPYGAFQKTNDDMILDFLSRNMKVVYESYKARVYLWER